MCWYRKVVIPLIVVCVFIGYEFIYVCLRVCAQLIGCHFIALVSASQRLLLIDLPLATGCYCSNCK